MARVQATNRVAAANRVAASNRFLVRDMYGEALTLNGVAGQATVGDANQLDLTSSYAAAMWILPFGWGESNTGRIYSKFPVGVSTGYSLALSLSAVGNNTCFITHVSTNIGFANNAISLNRWQHIGVVYNDTADTVQLYVNGSTFGTPVAATLNPTSGSGNLLIGNRADNSGDRTFNGKILEPIFFNNTITAAEMQELYLQGPGRLSADSRCVFLGSGTSGAATTYTDNSSYANNGTVATATFTSDWPIRSRVAI